mmetsp:Transcript_88344/g.248854  ORF Transcript_88344/g.248854 Transcript_88344/m.248854 type:complete len:215 (+) Transcript_88344:1027-1671(+)
MTLCPTQHRSFPAPIRRHRSNRHHRSPSSQKRRHWSLCQGERLSASRSREGNCSRAAERRVLASFVDLRRSKRNSLVHAGFDLCRWSTCASPRLRADAPLFVLIPSRRKQHPPRRELWCRCLSAACRESPQARPSLFLPSWRRDAWRCLVGQALRWPGSGRAEEPASSRRPPPRKAASLKHVGQRTPRQWPRGTACCRSRNSAWRIWKRPHSSG